MTTTPFPAWLETAWQQLQRSWRQHRLPHALMLAGAEGVGKRLLADRLTGLLLCLRPGDQGEACGRCQACIWLDAGTHPDLTTLAPDEPGKSIRIDQVRALGVELGMTSHGGRHKVALIAPADAMNANAANSLLKTLEEPTKDTLLILLSASPGRLPATVRSRCQTIRLHTPPVEQALDWLTTAGVDATLGRRCLQLAAGAPLAAAALAGSELPALHDERLEALAGVYQGSLDPLRLAADWQGEHEARTLQWWQGWVRALLRWQQAGVEPAEPKLAQTLQRVSESVDCRQLHALYDRIAAATGTLGSGLNRQLLLEDLLIDWARLSGRQPGTGAAKGYTKKTL